MTQVFIPVIPGLNGTREQRGALGKHGAGSVGGWVGMRGDHLTVLCALWYHLLVGWLRFTVALVGLKSSPGLPASRWHLAW